MIDEVIIVPLEGDYSPQAIRRKFEARAREFRRRREAMNGVAIVSETKINGMRIDVYTNGKVIVWFDPTYELNLSTGKGPRENTASLYGYVELTPRPASGTRALERSSAPTEIHSP